MNKSHSYPMTAPPPQPAMIAAMIRRISKTTSFHFITLYYLELEYLPQRIFFVDLTYEVGIYLDAVLDK